MGDRGNIGFIQHTPIEVRGKWVMKVDSAIFLYTHSYGYRVEALAAEAIKASAPRHGDETYATRMALTALIGKVEGDTGWGVGTHTGENSYPIPVIDFERREVRIIDTETGDSNDLEAILAAFGLAKVETFEAFLGRVAIDAA